jgi:hypothetical protein
VVSITQSRSQNNPAPDLQQLAEGDLSKVPTEIWAEYDCAMERGKADYRCRHEQL